MEITILPSCRIPQVQSPSVEPAGTAKNQLPVFRSTTPLGKFPRGSGMKLPSPWARIIECAEAIDEPGRISAQINFTRCMSQSTKATYAAIAATGIASTMIVPWYQRSFILTPNDEVERRGVAPQSNEGTSSPSSTPSLAYRRRDPRSLEPIVRRIANVNQDGPTE